MEEVPYNMAKRYAEIMKTMWFTFFYAPAIPIGIVWSAVGILFYYWVDKVIIFILKILLNLNMVIFINFSTI